MTQEELEQLRLFMMNGGGTNLAGQSTAQSAPRPDTNYSSGFDYARSIAGGIPASQMIAPGVSYSPSQPSGYTQQDLNMIARGPAPVMPDAPTDDDIATIEDQMPYAPPGVTQPNPFPSVDYLQGLDFSGLPGLGNIDIDAVIQEYQNRQDAGEPEPFESFLTDINTSGTNNPNLGLGLSNTFPPAMNFMPNQGMDFSKIDFSKINPNINFSMPDITQPMNNPKGGLFDGIGKGITGLQGMQKDFTGFKEDMKNKAANKVRGLFGI